MLRRPLVCTLERSYLVLEVGTDCGAPFWLATPSCVKSVPDKDDNDAAPAKASDAAHLVCSFLSPALAKVRWIRLFGFAQFQAITPPSLSLPQNKVFHVCLGTKLVGTEDGSGDGRCKSGNVTHYSQVACQVEKCKQSYCDISGCIPELLISQGVCVCVNVYFSEKLIQRYRNVILVKLASFSDPV
jgi:hypothetical protein